MPKIRPLTEALSKGCSRPPHPPRPHPTSATTAAIAFPQTQRQSFSVPDSRRTNLSKIAQKRNLSTNQRPTPPPPPPTQKQPTDAETERAIAEAERIAFSSLAWSHSVINSGNPIFSQDFDNEPAPIYQPPPAPAEANIPTIPIFAPYAFTTSITNTGFPFDDYEYNPVDPRLVRPATTTNPSYQQYVPPAFTTSITNTGNPYEDFDLNLIDPSLSRPATNKAHLDSNTTATRVINTAAMSDSDYAAFLEKQSGGSSSMSAQQSGGKEGAFTTSSVNTEVPVGLKNIEATYASEADEAFEPVALSLGELKVGKKVTLGRLFAISHHSCFHCH